MKSSGLRAFGNRALYGIVAGTCVLIGIAALVLQFATRPGAARDAGDGRVDACAGVAASADADVALAAGRDRDRAPAGARRRRRPSPRPAARLRPRRVAVNGGVGASTARRQRPSPVTVAAAPASVAAPHGAAPGAVPLEGQARCIEILQKASLEKITPAETDFFKRECK